MSSQGMIYRLFTYPVAHQLLVLDQLAQAGFKVMYEVGQQVHTHTHTHTGWMSAMLLGSQ